MPGAVLWDLDGTIVDSEEYHWLSWRDTISAEGVSITYEQFLVSFGQRNDAIIPSWLPEATPRQIQLIGDAKEVEFRRLVRERGLSSLPGVARWVEHLHQNAWPQAIASSAPRANVEAILETLGLGKYFRAVVTAADVKRGKPEPDVFLAAAERLGVEAARCIVVEDAAPGVEAARRAGMRSVGVSRNTAKLSAADIVVASLQDLPPDAFDRLAGES